MRLQCAGSSHCSPLLTSHTWSVSLAGFCLRRDRLLQDQGYCSSAGRESQWASSCCSHMPRGHTLLATGLEQGSHPPFPVPIHPSPSESRKSLVGPQAFAEGLEMWPWEAVFRAWWPQQELHRLMSFRVCPGFLTRELAADSDSSNPPCWAPSACMAGQSISVPSLCGNELCPCGCRGLAFSLLSSFSCWSFDEPTGGPRSLFVPPQSPLTIQVLAFQEEGSESSP